MEILKLDMDMQPTKTGMAVSFGVKIQSKVEEMLEKEEHKEMHKHLVEISRIFNAAIERDIKNTLSGLVSLIDEELSVTVVEEEEEELNEVDKEDIKKEIESFFDNLEKLLTKKQ